MKGNWFSRFLRNRDLFGHAITLEYKGSDTYNSVIGGILTILVQVLTLVMVIQAVQELMLMQDPQIINYSKDVNTQEEISELIPLNFGDYDYVIAFIVGT